MKTSSSVSQNHMVFNKAFGQHILINPHILNNIVEKSAIKPTDVVLEIGPGTGNLTQLLLERAKKVIAVELDPRMVAQLTKRFKYGQYASKFTLIPGDILAVDLPFFDVCVANVPYQISSPIVFKLLSHKPTFRCAVLMFQKQFAQRMVAQPGSELYCRLSVNVQLLSRVDHLMKVSKNNFKPPPKVESSVIRMQPKNPPPQIDYLEWDGLLRICFIRKNKQLGALFKQKKILALMCANAKTIQQSGMQTQLPKGFGKQNDNNAAIQGQVQICDDNGSDDDEMQVEQEGKSSNKVDPQFRQKIMKILTDSSYIQKRPSKLTIQDYLKLLFLFNSNGVHFR